MHLTSAKAGYTIPSDGAIRLDGVIYPLEIEGELHLKISPPKKDAKDFQLFLSHRLMKNKRM